MSKQETRLREYLERQWADAICAAADAMDLRQRRVAFALANRRRPRGR